MGPGRPIVPNQKPADDLPEAVYRPRSRRWSKRIFRCTKCRAGVKAENATYDAVLACWTHDVRNSGHARRNKCSGRLDELWPKPCLQVRGAPSKESAAVSS